MRLIYFDRPTEKRHHFYPLALSRPIFELRCGMTSLLDKMIAKTAAKDVACFVPEYMLASYKGKTNRPVNDLKTLGGDDLLLVDAKVKAAEFNVPPAGPSQIGLDGDGEVLYVRMAKADLGKLKTGSLDAFLESAKSVLPKAAEPVTVWNYTWDLVLANPAQLAADFAAAGRSGIEGKIEEPRAIRGSAKDVYVAPGAAIHPLVVIDAEHGPVYLDEGVEVHPFTRIEGPCYVGKKSILLGLQVPRRELDRPDVPLGRRSRGVDHPRLLEQVSRRLPGPRLRGRVGQLRRADDQQRLEKRLFERLGRARRQDAHQHRLDQGRFAHRRPHEDFDRHAVQYRRSTWGR